MKAGCKFSNLFNFIFYIFSSFSNVSAILRSCTKGPQWHDIASEVFNISIWLVLRLYWICRFLQLIQLGLNILLQCIYGWGCSSKCRCFLGSKASLLLLSEKIPERRHLRSDFTSMPNELEQELGKIRSELSKLKYRVAKIASAKPD